MLGKKSSQRNLRKMTLTDKEKLEAIKKIVYEHLPYPNVAIRNDLVNAIKEIDKILEKKYQ